MEGIHPYDGRKTPTDSEEKTTDSREARRTGLRRCDDHGPWRAVYALLACPAPDGDAAADRAAAGPGGSSR